MDILNRQNLPLRIVCEQEIQRMTEDEFSDLMGLSKTHQVILVSFDAESGKTQAAHIIPEEEFTQAIESIADDLDAIRKQNAIVEAALADGAADNDATPDAKTEG